MPDRPITPSSLAYAPKIRAALAEGGWCASALVNGGIATVYFGLGAIVSSFFSAYGLFPAPIWLPVTIAMVAAMVGEWRVLPGLFVGSFLTNALLFQPPLYMSTIISVTNALGPVLGAIALRHLRGGDGVFTSLRGVTRFLLCAVVLSPAVSATGGALALAIGHPFDFAKTSSLWTAWWLCDSGGTLYLTPALLLWLGLEKADTSSPDEGASITWQNLAVWTGIAGASVILFLSPPVHGNPLRQMIPVLLVVPLSWVALRVSLRSAYTLVSLVSIIAAVGTVMGLGAFQDDGVANPLQMVGVLVVLLAMDVLTTVALVCELHQAQDHNRVKAMSLATTSHELRSPLNAIIGYASMIESQIAGPIGDKRYAEFAGTIQTAGNHLLSLINGLLELSKIEAGKLSLSEEPVIVAEAIEEVVMLCRPLAQAKQIALAGTVEPQCEAVYADPGALRQILINLVNNAIKFTPPNGRVSVEASRNAEGELLLNVRDTGPGIAPEGLARLFVPFERLSHAGTGVEGAGLGLCITRGLVELHGGRIRMESVLGAGTTAIVILPASRVIAASPVAGPDLAAAA